MVALPSTYAARKNKPSLVEVPSQQFLVVDGRGAPEGAAYMEAIQALYSIAYGTKFALKPAGLDFRVMPLETLWWSDDGVFSPTDSDAWSWRAMIPVPDQVTPSVVALEIERTSQKRDLPGLSGLRLERFHEGLSAQVLHVGPYQSEQATIELLHKFIAEEGYISHGRHHEIYISDPRRTAPERIKTIIRQPVTR